MCEALNPIFMVPAVFVESRNASIAISVSEVTWIATPFLFSHAYSIADQPQHILLLLPVSRFGLTVRRQAGKQRNLGSNLLRLAFLFKSCGLWTPFCDFVSCTKL